MSYLALDWNATRIRAVLGALGATPLPMALEPPALELALALRLDKAPPEVGIAALRLGRLAPHQVCQAFLPHLSEQPGQGPRWQAGSRPFDARDACELVWRKLSRLGANSQGVVLSLPGYFDPAQANALLKLGARARLPLLGSIPTLLCAALAGHREQCWQRSVLVIDADEHALTLGWVKALAGKAHLVESRTLPLLGWSQLREKLIDGLADLFVMNHRRDPRDVPAAEQSLFDQLDPLIDAAAKHQAIQLGVQGREWFKHLVVHPDQTLQICAPLMRQAAHEAESMLSCRPAHEMPRSILVTHDAGRMPGLMDALHTLVLPSISSAETKLPQTKVTNYVDEDFGDALMFSDAHEHGGVVVLPPEAPAVAAHGLADLFRQGILAAGPIETIAPLAFVEPRRILPLAAVRSV